MEQRGTFRYRPDNFRLPRAADAVRTRRARAAGRNRANDCRWPRRARGRYPRILERRRHAGRSRSRARMVQAKEKAPMSLPDGWDREELARATSLAARVRASVDARVLAARAPGRVNLIGEHTDYSGLPVLPVAIDRSTIVVAAANTTGEIEVTNADPAWPSRRFAIERKIPPYASGDWANYVKAAIQGVIDRFPARHLRGASMVVDGRVPPAAGLSS